MSDLVSFAVATAGLPDSQRTLFVESLAIGASRYDDRALSAVLDPQAGLRLRHGRINSNDQAAKYARGLGLRDAPVLNRNDFREFCRDASRNRELSSRRKLLVFVDEPPDVERLRLFDGLLLPVGTGSTAAAFVFETLRKCRPERCHIAVVGVPDIEIAASYYVDLKEEMRRMGFGNTAFEFAGMMHFDRDHVRIASEWDIPLLEAFEGYGTDGQTAYVMRKLFDKNGPHPIPDETRYAELARAC